MFIFLVCKIFSVRHRLIHLLVGIDFDLLGVIVFIRLFWLVGIAGAVQTLLIVLICSSCVCQNTSTVVFICSLLICYLDSSDSYIHGSDCDEWNRTSRWSVFYDITFTGSGIWRCCRDLILSWKYVCGIDVYRWSSGNCCCTLLNYLFLSFFHSLLFSSRNTCVRKNVVFLEMTLKSHRSHSIIIEYMEHAYFLSLELVF